MEEAEVVFQFGHMNTYSRKPKSGKKKVARNVREILAEADRVVENIPHVTNPKPPIVVSGCTPTELAERVDALLVERAIEGKRTPRGDVHVLAAAVYSWPEHVNDYDKSRLWRWIYDQLEWHAIHVGLVDSAVLHLDETFPHVHIYTVDPDARRLSPGWQAKRQTEAAGLAAKLPQNVICQQANAAYKAAMVLWQDALYEGVNKFHGLDRLGPKRQRYPTSHAYLKYKKESSAAGDRQYALRESEKKKKAELASITLQIEELNDELSQLREYVALERVEAYVDASNYHAEANREKDKLDALKTDRAMLERELKGMEFAAHMSRDTAKRLQYEIETLEKRRDELRDSGGNVAPAAKPTPPKRGGPSFGM